MEMLQEEDPTKYEAHFSKFIAADIDAEKIEEMYSSAHEKIKENPDGKDAAKKGLTYTRKGNTVACSDGTEHVSTVKLSLKQRKRKCLQPTSKCLEMCVDLCGTDTSSLLRAH